MLRPGRRSVRRRSAHTAIAPVGAHEIVGSGAALVLDRGDWRVPKAGARPDEADAFDRSTRTRRRVARVRSTAGRVLEKAGESAACIGEGPGRAKGCRNEDEQRSADRRDGLETNARAGRRRTRRTKRSTHESRVFTCGRSEDRADSGSRADLARDSHCDDDGFRLRGSPQASLVFDQRAWRCWRRLWRSSGWGERTPISMPRWR